MTNIINNTLMEVKLLLHPKEMNEQGILWFKAGNMHEAKKCWENAAKHGDASAMFCLGVLCLTAEYDRNTVLAKEWFLKAEKAGHKNARMQIDKLNNSTSCSEFERNALFLNQKKDISINQFHTIKLGQLEWYILMEKQDRKLCLSKNVIDIRKYSDIHSTVTWGNSQIRFWLNSAFYNEFLSDEQYLVCDTVLNNSCNPIYGTYAGQNTTDKVFLLSYSEVVECFMNLNLESTNVDLLSYASDNAALIATVKMSQEQLADASIRTGIDYSMINGQSIGWWLRTPGADSKRVVRINCNGAIRLHGREANRNLVGVRPALWRRNDE